MIRQGQRLQLAVLLRLMYVMTLVLLKPKIFVEFGT